MLLFPHMSAVFGSILGTFCLHQARDLPVLDPVLHSFIHSPAPLGGGGWVHFCASSRDSQNSQVPPDKQRDAIQLAWHHLLGQMNQCFVERLFCCQVGCVDLSVLPV